MDGFVASQLLARGSSEWVGPGLTGFVVIAALGVAIYFLWRSMNHQLRKVRFDEQESPDDVRGPRPSGTPENGQT